MGTALLTTLRDAARARRPARAADLLVSVAFWTIVVAYIVTFCAIALRRYDAFLMHALDMGNMEQAVWNTAHGHPFRFTNMRQHLPIEAFGTDTRLSFHVEPILLPLAFIHLLYPHPQMLLILQTVALASGAVPARRLARRHLPGSRLAELAFPIAYLLYPALQAANLYEFHPVTLTAALLLWAIDLADEGRPLPFVLVAVAAIACKEEIGLDVALLALWSLCRGMPRRVAIPLAVGAAVWALFAVLVIIPAAEHAQHSTVADSPYLTRYLDRELTTPGRYKQVTAGVVVRYWVSHPDRLAGMVLGPTKRGFVQRILAPAGYLPLLSPSTLAIGLPSFLLIVLSLDQHMYGGLGHYSAELVGVALAAAIFGAERLAGWAGRRRLRAGAVSTGACVLLLVLSLSNARLNGFTPLSDNFEWPALSAHVRLGQQMLAMIPADAAIAAQDTLDPHLSDRAGIFLFPDVADAEYVALDVSASPIPLGPDSLHDEVESLLRGRHWRILFARDGYLLLHRVAATLPAVPQLPAAFYSFALPVRPDIEHPLRVRAGGNVLMLGYSIRRRETVNLRVPDMVLTTYWMATAPVRRPLSMTTYLTNIHGKPVNYFAAQAALSWLPITTWRPGRVVAVSSTSMGIAATDPGSVQACLSVHDPGADAQARRLSLRIQAAAASGDPHRLLDGGTILCVGSVPVIF